MFKSPLRRLCAVALTLGSAPLQAGDWRESQLMSEGVMDVGMPLFGDLRLDLRPSGAAEPLARGWTLGAVLEQSTVLGAGASNDRYGLAPQLTLDLRALRPSAGQFNLCLRYAHWQMRSADADDGPAPQLVLKWAF